MENENENENKIELFTFNKAVPMQDNIKKFVASKIAFWQILKTGVHFMYSSNNIKSMKTTKIVLVAFVLGLCLAIAGSTYAFMLNIKYPTESKVTVPTPTKKEAVLKPTQSTVVDISDDPSNGTECGESCQLEKEQPLEYRLRVIEERLDRLEGKR